MRATNIVAVVATAAAIALPGCGDGDQQPTAGGPEGRVIDEVAISPADFGDPTRITNELYPISEVTHIVMLGEDEGEPLRVEVTLLPVTRTIEWDGGSTEAVVSQFVAVTDGELVEVAEDWFAQDDSGNVWYFGEDVLNYDRGEVADTDGSWTAGADGPPGMIMPASPEVGDVYHPENIPGLVFEEDVVISLDETVEGPTGPIRGVMKVEEHLMEGDVEEKYWAPGYGEFRAIHPGVEDVTVVFALPNDAQAEPPPASLEALQAAAAGCFDLARGGDRAALAPSVEAMSADWAAYDPSARSVLPEAFVEAVDDAIRDLSTTVEGEDVEAWAEACVELDLAVLDVVMTHGSLPDAQRIEALRDQATLASEAGDRAAVANADAIVEAIEARS